MPGVRTWPATPSDEDFRREWNAGRTKGLANESKAGMPDDIYLRAAWTRGYHHGIQERVLAKYGEPLS